HRFWRLHRIWDCPHVAKKLLQLIYTLQAKNIRYDPTMIANMHPLSCKSSAGVLGFLHPFSSLKNFFTKGLTSYSWSLRCSVFTSGDSKSLDGLMQ
ncbi:MAG TPA: hypothetical protein H9745_06920, partial [Candidatus Agathobaculum stercoravium]|nr:hypothetical protein [Candidatus Agathobaculum stercoravium]